MCRLQPRCYTAGGARSRDPTRTARDEGGSPGRCAGARRSPASSRRSQLFWKAPPPVSGRSPLFSKGSPDAPRVALNPLADAERAEPLEALEVRREESLDRARDLGAGIALHGPGPHRSGWTVAQREQGLPRALRNPEGAAVSPARRAAEEPAPERMEEPAALERRPALQARRQLGRQAEVPQGVDLKPAQDRLEGGERRRIHRGEGLGREVEEPRVARLSVRRAVKELEHR